jgi:L-asparagine oxygenase
VLNELTNAIARRHTAVVLEPGDLLVIDNSVAVHGRSPFTPRFDGTDRWLQRTFVVADLSASAGERDGRVITTRFGA